MVQVNHGQGQVKVFSNNKGYLNFQIPSIYAYRYWNKKQKYISFGAKDTTENRILADELKHKLQYDLEQHSFNPHSLDKYKHPSKQQRYSYTFEKINLMDLWSRYLIYKKPLVRETTYKLRYETTFSNYIKQCPKDLLNQGEIKNFIFNNVAYSVAQPLFAAIDNAIEWGKEEGLLPKHIDNKFKQYKKEHKKAYKNVNTSRKKPKRYKDTVDIEGKKAFTKEEMELIIKGFHNRTKRDPYYKKCDVVAYLVEFLFRTGVRHGEAFSLTWGDLNPTLTEMRINTSYSTALKIVTDTKTGKCRTVPLSPRVQEILSILKDSQSNPTSSDLVFQNKIGNPFTSALLYTYWSGGASIKPILKQLHDKETLDKYADPYSTRRTFISNQIRTYDVATVAKWVGDNPETILKHYARYDEHAVPID